ncbi:hypothetical protein Ddye_025469 [Dipteronia dyeriana]|uniref:Uncharacterized protein n=1 Tax=Dipteronia dyeriana TaxID=168575 RepID=A0AAD9TK97_9ROSI|nr:hypothetical protein Ddye_025469 [Dipteronia dyeriana]
MFTLTALDKLCATKRVFTKMIKEDRKYDRQIDDEVPSDADIESIFLEQDDVNSHTTFIIQDSEDASLSSESSDYSELDFPSEAYQVTSGNSLYLGPQIQVQILAEKYSKPISAIAYFDTGAHSTMMNP